MPLNFKQNFDLLKEEAKNKERSQFSKLIEDCFASSKTETQLKMLYDYLLDEETDITDFPSKFRRLFLKYPYSWVKDFWFINPTEPLSRDELYYLYDNIKTKGVKALQKYLSNTSIYRDILLNNNQLKTKNLLEYCLDEYLKSQRNYTKIKARLIECIKFLQQNNVYVDYQNYSSKTQPSQYYFSNLDEIKEFFTLDKITYSISIQKHKYNCGIEDAVLWHDFNNEMLNVIKHYDFYKKQNYTLEKIIENFNTTPFFKGFIDHYITTKTKNMKKLDIKNELIAILNKIRLEDTFAKPKNSNKKIVM